MVSLGLGAWIKLRPARSTEVDEAAAEVGLQVAGLVVGGASADAIKALLPDFDLGDLVDLSAGDGLDPATRLTLGLRNKIERITDRLILVSLITRCNDGWTGVTDEVDRPLDLDAGAVALLLEDNVCKTACHNAIFSRVHDEAVEGNGSAVSPDGAAAAADLTAKDADRSDRLAPADVQATTANDARN